MNRVCEIGSRLDSRLTCPSSVPCDQQDRVRYLAVFKPHKANQVERARQSLTQRRKRQRCWHVY
jgi:hypothetical protein